MIKRQPTLSDHRGMTTHTDPVPTISGVYIEMEGPDHIAAVVDALTPVLNALAGDWEPTTHPLLRLRRDRLEVILDHGYAGADTARLAIADLDGDTVSLRATAGHIYDMLAANTTWRLRWSADA